MALTYRQMADHALQDLYRKFWDDDGGHMYPVHCGKIVEKPLMIWEMATFLFAMEMYYDATGDKETAKRIVSTWDYLHKECFTDEQLSSRFGYEPNLALDDTGWDIMTYLLAYRFTGDPYPLDLARRCLLGAYDHWKDGSCSNGLWYNDIKQYGEQWKSSYVVSLLISAVDYLQITGGKGPDDDRLLRETMEIYEWVEKFLRRDRIVTYENGLQNGSPYTISTIDYLYWTDFNVNRETKPERNGPDGGAHPEFITDRGSYSALFGNMGMAALNAMLYRTTGDGRAMEKALETAHSMSKIYCRNGAYLNDRDPWTNATMLRYYIREVLTRPEITPVERRMVLTTADNVVHNAGLFDGVYTSCWQRLPEGSAMPQRNDPEKLMTNATSVSMICGAALIESMGLAVD